MNKSITGLAVALWLCFTACTRQSNSGAQIQEVDTAANQKTSDMKNLVSIVEIPTEDLSRAMVFYQAILNINIEVVDMDGMKLGLFPHTGEGVFVQLIHGGVYKPSADGAVVYLNAGGDLQKVVDKIAAHGGKVMMAKTEIGPDMGFYALFMDTEGNKLGLHSLH